VLQSEITLLRDIDLILARATSIPQVLLLTRGIRPRDARKQVGVRNGPIGKKKVMTKWIIFSPFNIILYRHKYN